MTITIDGSGTITGASTLATTVASPTLTSPNLTTPNIDSAQVATVSGTAPLYMCRAWVNFNGTGTVAIRASGNVSSITDSGTGDYTVNFTTAMPDANYSVVLGSERTGVNDTGNICFQSVTTTTVSVSTFPYNSTTRADVAVVGVSIFR